MKTARQKPLPASQKRSAAASAAKSSESKPLTADIGPLLRTPSKMGGSRWSFLTNHSHVLVLLSRDPSLVLREVALQVGITERAVQRIIADLENGGIIEREKVGRQNRYRILTEQSLRHEIESHRTIGELLDLINGD